MQIEWLTGGKCLAGMHEVTVTNRTLEAIELAKQQNGSIWRVSSTVSIIVSFGYIWVCHPLIFLFSCHLC